MVVCHIYTVFTYIGYTMHNNYSCLHGLVGFIVYTRIQWSMTRLHKWPVAEFNIV